MNTDWIFILVMLVLLSGCGTIGTIVLEAEGNPNVEEYENMIFSGVRHDLDAWTHGWIFDIPFSLVADVVVLPYTITKTVINKVSIKSEIEGENTEP